MRKITLAMRLRSTEPQMGGRESGGVRGHSPSLYYLASFDAHFAKRYEVILSNARGRIREHLQACVRDKLLPESTDVAMAELLHDALLGGIVNFLSVKKANKNPETPVQRAEALFEKIFA